MAKKDKNDKVVLFGEEIGSGRRREDGELWGFLLVFAGSLFILVPIFRTTC